MGKIVKSGPKRPNPEGRRVQRDRLSGRFAHLSKGLVFDPGMKQLVVAPGPGSTFRYPVRQPRVDPKVSMSKRKPAPGFLSRRARGQGYSNALAECAGKWRRRG